MKAQILNCLIKSGFTEVQNQITFVETFKSQFMMLEELWRIPSLGHPHKIWIKFLFKHYRTIHWKHWRRKNHDTVAGGSAFFCCHSSKLVFGLLREHWIWLTIQWGQKYSVFFARHWSVYNMIMCSFMLSLLLINATHIIINATHVYFISWSVTGWLLDRTVI